MVGLAGFEPASIAPEATSLDQASRQPRAVGLRCYVLLWVTKISIPQAGSRSGRVQQKLQAKY